MAKRRHGLKYLLSVGLKIIHILLRSWDDENHELEDEEDKDEDIPNPDIINMTEEDWQTWAHLHPNV
ncbi:hypothetical protein PTI98_011874 [Pleurotus ostreatus]|nr:hypothetical protein PTI98_011874 [Pleurotus ostreatus]